MSGAFEMLDLFLCLESVQNADGPLLVEITRSIGSNLGMSVSQQVIQGKSVFVIDTVYTGSIAER